MTRKRTRQTQYDGAVYTHRVLWDTAYRFLMHTQKGGPGWYYHAIGAAMFSWLAFEAYLNAVVEHLRPGLDEREFFTRKNGYPGVLGKLRWVLKEIDAHPTGAAERRRRTVLRLHRLRDELAHAKQIRFSRMIRHPADEDPPFMGPEWIEAQVTKAKTRRYVEAVDAFAEWINRRMKPPFPDPHMRQSAFKGTTQSGRWSPPRKR